MFKYVQTNTEEMTEEKAKEIIRFASACGSLVCSGMGAIDPQPTSEQVLDFLMETK